MAEEAVHLFQKLASKYWDEGNPNYNKEEKNWIMIC